MRDTDYSIAQEELEQDTIDVSDVVDHFIDIHRSVNGRNRATRADYKKASKFVIDAVNIAYDTYKVADPMPAASLNLNADSKRSMIVTLFDSHFGEVIYKEDPYGKKETVVVYNFKIAKAKVDLLYKKAIYHMHNIGFDKFDELILAIGGDNVDGDGTVYPGQRHAIEAEVMDQKIKFSEEIMSVISRGSSLMKITGGVVRVVGVAGNHGKNKADPASHSINENHDTSTYKMVEMMMNASQEDLSNVELSYSKSIGYRGFETKGWNYILYHALPKNLESASSKAKMNGISEIFNADVVLTGHFHETALVKHGKATVLRTGSVPGPNDFSNELAIYSPFGSEQACIVVSPEDKIEYLIPINLNIPNE